MPETFNILDTFPGDGPVVATTSDWMTVPADPKPLDAYWMADEGLVRAYDSTWFSWVWWSYCVYPQ